MKKIFAYARLLRIPGIGGLAIPPVIGAISVGVFDLYKLLLLFIIGALSALFGFILNDYVDIDVDKKCADLKDKPLVSGEISAKTTILICIFFVLISYLLIGILWYNQTIDHYRFNALLSVFIAGVLGVIYNFYGKKFAGSDFLVALAMGFMFLFGALSVGQPNIITWIIFILTFNNLLHMNAIEGGIKDSDHDHMMGVKNIALGSGVKVHGYNITIPHVFKLFSLSIRSFTAILLFLPFIYFGYDYFIWQIIVLLLAIIGVYYLSIKLITIKQFNRDKIRKYIAGQAFLRYSLVPIMLISIIGFEKSIILIFFPIIWYIVFAPLTREKMLRPKM